MREGKKERNRLITAAMAGILTLFLSLAALPMELRAMENRDSYEIYILDYEDLLTDEEMSVYRRGRNTKSATAAKNAPVGDYRKATGLEALIGYLYLKGDMQRVMDIMEAVMSVV